MPDASLRPGFASPLWHGSLASSLVFRERSCGSWCLHLPSILAVLAIAIAYGAGWALFRSVSAAGAVAGAPAGIICFAPGSGGAYAFLSLPATSSPLLMPATLTLTLSASLLPSRALLPSTAAAGLVLAVVHPTFAVSRIPFVGFLLVRALWTRRTSAPEAQRWPRSRCRHVLHALADPDHGRHGLGLSRPR